MKKFLLISFIMLNTTACGIAEDFGQTRCGGDLKMLCHMVTGGRVDEAQNELLSEHEQRLNDLEAESNMLRQQALAIQTQIDVMLANQEGSEAEVQQLENQLNQISLQITNITLQVAVHESYNNITQIIQPCPNMHSPSGYREVLLRTSQNQVLAYFEVNGRRFLSLLKTNSNYVLTDKSGCSFQTGPNMEISW